MPPVSPISVHLVAPTLAKSLLEYTFIRYTLIIYINDLGTLSFGQDDNGAWGYMIGGADTVYPFKTGEDASLLYESLKYSKLVTEDMTFEEMCTILSEYFALQDINMFNLSWSGTSNNVFRSSISSSGISITVYGSNDNEGWYGYITSSEVDVTDYKTIQITGSSKMSQPIDSSGAYKCRVNLILDGTTVNVFTSTVGSGSVQSISITRDISSYKKLKVQLQAFQYGSNNTGSYVTLNKSMILP